MAWFSALNLIYLKCFHTNQNWGYTNKGFSTQSLYIVSMIYIDHADKLKLKIT